MLNSLDLLVLIFMILFAASLLALCLMFLVKKPVIRKICFYMIVALGICTSAIGARIGTFLFPTQTAIAILTGIASITALVLERQSKENEKKFLLARILSAAALVIGICNAFIF